MRTDSTDGRGADAAYAAAVVLVDEIDRHLRRGSRHYRDADGRQLTALDDVVRAIVEDRLATDGPVV